MRYVLVPSHLEEALARTAGELPVELIPYDAHGNPARDSGAAEVLFRWWLTPEEGDLLIERHPRLRWIHTGSAGVDQIITPRFLSSEVVLTNSAGVHAASIAEWVVAAILAVQKDLFLMREQQTDRIWEKIERDELTGKRMLILGAGHIAREIASRVRPLGIHVCAARRRQPSCDHAFDEVVSIERLDAHVAEADWLVVALPLTSDTRGLVSAPLIRAMSPRAVVVNVARGEIVDEEALIDALRLGRIGGAVLDVFREEPLPPTHPLWAMKNVLVLPHTTWRSPHVKQKQIDLFATNLRHYVHGEPLVNVVDRSAGY